MAAEATRGWHTDLSSAKETIWEEGADGGKVIFIILVIHAHILYTRHIFIIGYQCT